MAKDRGLPWEKAKDIAHEAVEHAERKWRTANPARLPAKIAQADIDAARNDGFDLVTLALEYLTDSGIAYY